MTESNTTTINSYLSNVKDLLPNLPKKDIKIILDEFLKIITKTILKEQKVHLSGIGTFQVRKTQARMGRNPQTGEPLKIKASKKVIFRTSAPLKEKIRSKKRR
jgi:DNA-binding protein HU-beta